MINFIGKRKIWFILSGCFVTASIVLLLIFGLKLGIDFTGGSLLEVKLEKEFTADTVKESISEFDLGDVKVQPSGEGSVTIRTKQIDNELKNQVEDKLKENFGNVEEERFDTIGPTIGKELREKSIFVIIAVLFAIIAFMAYAFRKVSSAIPSWKFGVAAIVALGHDVIIILGVYAVLGVLLNIEIGTLFVVALLTVLGYSVNDTIVVFDRIRDKLFKERDLEKAANEGINSTLVRSINTSITTLLVLLAIFLFGGLTIQFFILALIIGVISGTYSSIFVATPFLVEWQTRVLGKRK